VPTVLTAGPCIGSSYRRRVGGKEDAHGIVCGANKCLEFPWDDVNENSRVFQKFRIQRSRPPYTVVACGWGTQVEPPGELRVQHELGLLIRQLHSCLATCHLHRRAQGPSHVPASREEHRHDCCQPDRP